MSRRALRCVVEIEVHTVTSHGTRLMSMNDVFVSICLFGQIQRTASASSIFPLIFYDKMKFEKVFYSAYDPALVSNALEEILVHVDLMQSSDAGGDARLLAWYNSTALQFLYPNPLYFSQYGLHDREVLMERSVIFPGISPKLEFSTRTVIQETPDIQLNPWPRDLLPTRRSRCSKQKMTAADRSTHQSRCHNVPPPPPPPLGSTHRCQSMSPRTCDRVKDLSLEDYDTTGSKPAFVVRKVPDDLIGRRPGGEHLSSSSHHTSPVKKSASAADVFQCSCHVQSCTICQAFQRYLGKPYHRHSCLCIHLKHLPVCSCNSGQGEKENALHFNDRNTCRISGSKVIHTVNSIPKESKKSDNRLTCGSKLRKQSLDPKKSSVLQSEKVFHLVNTEDVLDELQKYCYL